MANDAASEDTTPVSPNAPAPQEDARVVPVSLSEHAASADHRMTKLGSFRIWLPTRRTIVLCLAFLVPSAVIALSGFLIARDIAQGDPPAISTRGAAAPQIVEPSVVSTVAEPSAPAPPVAPPPVASTVVSPSAPPPPIENPEVPSPVFYDETDDGEPSATKRVQPKHFATVQQAVVESCSTASVEGLSRQIIEQARCIRQTAFVPLPARPNLVLASHVFPYLELGARNHLLRVLDAHPGGKMTINSALRTVAQQYLVWRWSASKQCGVQLATPPGESNHEIGIALDIAEAAQWRPALEAQEFHWLGTSDRVHFDYKGGGDPAPHGTMDVRAFQMLWNRNHPRDAIAADGKYNPATEQRLKKSPADGFPLGPTCGKAGTSGH